ncbi:MAG: universal stress protein [Acidobacteria bacterium]|nr:universal stress protein [Acidobacteriota bacterium]
MSEFRLNRILVGSELSAESMAPVAFASDLAEAVDAEVVLFHAVQPIRFGYGMGERDGIEGETGAQMEEAEARLDRIASELFPQQTTVKLRLATGSPIQLIAEVAEEESADLIVIGTHGYHPGIRYLLGSVAQGVLHSTDLPVITVPLDRDLQKDEILTILCPVNFTPIGQMGMILAAEMGRLLGAEVIALHLIESESTGDVAEHVQKLREWLPPHIFDACRVRIIARSGKAAEEVVKYARTQRVDLIVLGAQRRRFADTFEVGTTTERVTRHAPCPVLTVMSPSPDE